MKNNRLLFTCTALLYSMLLACNTNTPSQPANANNTQVNNVKPPAPGVKSEPSKKQDTIVAAILYAERTGQVDGCYDSVHEVFKECNHNNWESINKNDIIRYFPEPQCDETPKFAMCLRRTVDVNDKTGKPKYEELPALNVSFDAANKQVIVKDGNNNMVKSHVLEEKEFKNMVIANKNFESYKAKNMK